MIHFNIKTLTDVTKTAATALLAVGLLLFILGILVIVLRAVFVLIAAGLIFLAAIWCIGMALSMFIKLWLSPKPKDFYEDEDFDPAFRENVRVHRRDDDDDVV